MGVVRLNEPGFSTSVGDLFKNSLVRDGHERMLLRADDYRFLPQLEIETV